MAPYDTDPSFICEDYEWSGEELALAIAMLPRVEQLTPKETAAYHMCKRDSIVGGSTEYKILHVVMYHAAICSDINAVGAAIRLHLTGLKESGLLSKARDSVCLYVLGGSSVIPAMWTFDGVKDEVQMMTTESKLLQSAPGFTLPAWIDGLLQPIPDIPGVAGWAIAGETKVTVRSH